MTSQTPNIDSIQSALDSVRNAPFSDIFTSLSTFMSALLSGEKGALTPEIIASAYSAMSWLALPIFALVLLLVVATVTARLAKLGLMVATVTGFLVYIAANHAYLLAPLGV
jgi:hypothetical protein